MEKGMEIPLQKTQVFQREKNGAVSLEQHTSCNDKSGETSGSLTQANSDDGDVEASGEDRTECRNKDAHSTGGSPDNSDDGLPLPSSAQSAYLCEDSPPKGLLYSTPTKRPPKMTAFGDEVHSSSSSRRLIPAEAMMKYIRSGSDGNSPSKGITPQKRGSGTHHEPRAHDSKRHTGIGATSSQNPSTYNWVINNTQYQSHNDNPELRAIQDSSNDIDTMGHQSHEGSTEQLKSIFRPQKPIHYASSSTNSLAYTPSVSDYNNLTYFNGSIDLGSYSSFMQAFTPLDHSLSSDDSTQALEDNRNTEIFTFWSRQNMLKGKLRITLEKTSGTVMDLKIIELNDWADAELGAWLRMEDGFLDGKSFDTDKIIWTVDQFWKLALSRARCWLLCQKVFSAIIEVRSKNGSARVKDDLPDLEEEQIDSEDSGSIESIKSSDLEEAVESIADDDIMRRVLGSWFTAVKAGVSMDEIASQVGNQTLNLCGLETELFIQWTLNIDLSDTVQSKYSIDMKLPQQWHDVDEQRSLENIHKLFYFFVENDDIYKAIRVIFKLIFM